MKASFFAPTTARGPRLISSARRRDFAGVGCPNVGVVATVMPRQLCDVTG